MSLFFKPNHRQDAENKIFITNVAKCHMHVGKLFKTLYFNIPDGGLVLFLKSTILAIIDIAIS